MARVVRITENGEPEVMHWVDIDLPAPGPGQVRYRTTAVGLNFIDVYHRRGIYPGPLPGALGMEATGVVEAVGDGVDHLKIGDRVATFGPERGAYATERNLAASALFKLPDDISDEVAAAALLKGCTVEFLAERVWHVDAGDWVLVHAAAGGVGLILVQWLAAKGARVIGTVGSEDKAKLAREAGAAEVILSDREDIARRVREITGGDGVRVSYDGVGKATWEASLDATGVRGIIVSYGNASGPVENVSLGVLAAKGSLYNTRPTLFNYYATPADRETGAAALWEMIRAGKVSISIGQRYRLDDVVSAHRDLEARRTTGSTILLPNA
ncbi:quinone oxidoreductase family protein [Sphingomonas sp. GlSt437]|uniref:quinone oxidoreductase family protein n=1 Tax=Sphingomonas sp. GlSt437 TaxID=3389970 RepID=UPI003A861744